MSTIESVLAACELQHEEQLSAHIRAVHLKARWRALAVKHYFHVVPGDRILELGAGSGVWTEALAKELRSENPITAATFSADMAERVRSRQIPNTTVVAVKDFDNDLPAASFDYVIGSGLLWNEMLPEIIAIVYKLLKPGGQVLFIESNLAFPGRRLWAAVRSIFRSTFHSSPAKVLHAFSHQGFTHVDVNPYDFLSPALGARTLQFLQAKTLLLEHAPLLRNFCSAMLVCGRVPGPARQPLPDLAEHASLHGAVSVVIPCRNEAPNIAALADRLMTCYGRYIHEIVFVNDNSTDDTGAVVQKLGTLDSRIKVVNRTPPGGVGRALQDGYRAATGRYILTMDCDFIEIIPELRGLFDAVAQGYEGAIGSRFSHESILLNYPFGKLLCNRGVHMLIKCFLRDVRDVTNNLKLYRADILKNLKVESPHFSANLETGLKPMLAGYKVREVPVSWINRTVGMGSSSFNVKTVGFAYVQALVRIWKTNGSKRNRWFSDYGADDAVSPRSVA